MTIYSLDEPFFSPRSFVLLSILFQQVIVFDKSVSGACGRCWTDKGLAEVGGVWSGRKWPGIATEKNLVDSGKQEELEIY